jgi:NitT/TauT family transport system permease protein
MSVNHHPHRRHYHVHRISYPISLSQRIYSLFVGPALVVLLMILLVKIFAVDLPPISTTISGQALARTLVVALGSTLARLGTAYALSIIVAIPLAVLVTSTPRMQAVFLPVFDVLQSIPILAFFPVLILVFISVNALNGAAIAILFLTMVWTVVFTLVGGINVIPKEIIAAAELFGLRGWQYFWKVLLPAMVPQLVTGSILAVAGGWNIIIVAEVLHTYIPHGTSAQDLFGIGSILVSAAANGQNTIFIWAVVTMVLTIAIINFFIWQKLLHYAQRFRFE